MFICNEFLTFIEIVHALKVFEMNTYRILIFLNKYFGNYLLRVVQVNKNIKLYCIKCYVQSPSYNFNKIIGILKRLFRITIFSRTAYYHLILWSFYFLQYWVVDSTAVMSYTYHTHPIFEVFGVQKNFYNSLVVSKDIIKTLYLILESFLQFQLEL